MRETTALGAAIAAGLAVGLWRNFAELRDINRAGGTVFKPKMSRPESAKLFTNWEKAVSMSRGWVGDKPPRFLETKEIPGLAKNSINKSSSMKSKAVKVNGDLPLSKTPLISISSDLDDADEEDLFLELRKIEILQKLKKIRKLKVVYF